VVHLELATEEEKIERDRLSHAAWGDRLTVDQYVAREARLRAHPFCRGMETWLLRDDTGSVLASCESFATPAAAGARSGVAYAIASVFTAAQLRGRGHAGAMMRKLVTRLAERPDALATVLYSDVGTAIYERAGYVAVPAHDRVLSPDETQSDADPIEESVLARALPPAPGGRFVTWPSADQLDWHLERERIYADALRRSRPPCAGARRGEAVAFWAADFKGNKLVILLLSGTDETDVLAVLRAARRAAAHAGLTSIHLWEDASTEGLPAHVGERRPREGSIPMIRPFHESFGPEDWRIVPRGIWV
jgi:hypothetical protein